MLRRLACSLFGGAFRVFYTAMSFDRSRFQSDFLKKGCEPGIGTKSIHFGIYFERAQRLGTAGNTLLEPGEGRIVLPEQCIDKRDPSQQVPIREFLRIQLLDLRSRLIDVTGRSVNLREGS